MQGGDDPTALADTLACPDARGVGVAGRTSGPVDSSPRALMVQPGPPGATSTDQPAGSSAAHPTAPAKATAAASAVPGPPAGADQPPARAQAAEMPAPQDGGQAGAGAATPGQPKSPLTFDDLLPLLTSQHRTSSSNNDALMDLYGSFIRHGSGSFRPPVARDGSTLSGALMRLASGLGSGGLLLSSPLLRGSPLGDLARLESLSSQGAGSGGALLSPNLAALLSANPLDRDGSMDWMAWPPPRPTAGQGAAPASPPMTPPPPAAAAAASSQQLPHPQPLLEAAPSVNHWLPSAHGPPATAPAAAPTGGFGPPFGPQHSPLLQGHNQLLLHQIQIGGEPLFHPPAGATPHHSLPLHSGLAGQLGPSAAFNTPAAGYSAPPGLTGFPAGPGAAAAVAGGGGGALPLGMGPGGWGLAGTGPGQGPGPYDLGSGQPQGPFSHLSGPHSGMIPPQQYQLQLEAAAAAAAAAGLHGPGLRPQVSREEARAARALRKQKLQEKRAQGRASGQGLQQGEQGRTGPQRRVYHSQAERLRARREARNAAQYEAQAIMAEALQLTQTQAHTQAQAQAGAGSMLSAPGLWGQPPLLQPQAGGLNPGSALPPGYSSGSAGTLSGVAHPVGTGFAGSLMQPGPGPVSHGSMHSQYQHNQQGPLSLRQQMMGAAGLGGLWQQGVGNPAGGVNPLADASDSTDTDSDDDSSSDSDDNPQSGLPAAAHMWSGAAAAAAAAGSSLRGLSGAVARRDTAQSSNTPLGPLMSLPQVAHNQQQWMQQAGPGHLSGPLSTGGVPPVTGAAQPLQQQLLAPQAGSLMRQGSLAAERPRRQIKMTAAAAAAVAASDSDGEGSPPPGRQAGRGRKKGGAATAAAAPAAAAARGTKKRGRQAAAAGSSSGGSESSPGSQEEEEEDASSSEDSGAAVSRRRRSSSSRRSNPSGAAASTARGAASSSSSKPKRRAGRAAAVKLSKPSKGSPGVSGAGGEGSRPVYEDTRSQFRGVTRHRRSGRWEAHIWIKQLGRQVYLGGYDDEEAAAEAYDMAALKSKGPGCPTNFPSERYAAVLDSMGNVTLEGLIMAVRRQSQGFSRGSSTYRGVTAHPSGRWESRIGIPGSKHVYLGLYNQEAAAAQAYDGALVRFKGAAAATNFSVALYQQQLAEHHQMKLAAQEGLTDGDILSQQSGPDFELFIKTGLSSFGIEVSPAAWELAHAETAAGQPGAGTGAAAAGAPGGGTAE